MVGADIWIIGLDGRATIVTIELCRGWCGLKCANRTAGALLAGSLVKSLPPQARWQIGPLPGDAAQVQCSVEAFRQTCADRVTDMPSPHLNLTLYIGGMLFKIDHFYTLCNYTFVHRSFPGSTQRNPWSVRELAQGGGLPLGAVGDLLFTSGIGPQVRELTSGATLRPHAHIQVAATGCAGAGLC